MLDQEEEQLHGDALELQPAARAAQFVGADVQLKLGP
jgi:hypothetical protein